MFNNLYGSKVDVALLKVDDGHPTLTRF